jgi:hypothetical protein
MSTDIAFRAHLGAIVIDSDVRCLVQRLADDPRADAEAMMALHDALLELAEINFRIDLPTAGNGYRRCAALVSDHLARMQPAGEA